MSLTLKALRSRFVGILETVSILVLGTALSMMARTESDGRGRVMGVTEEERSGCVTRYVLRVGSRSRLVGRDTPVTVLFDCVVLEVVLVGWAVWKDKKAKRGVVFIPQGSVEAAGSDLTFGPMVLFA